MIALKQEPPTDNQLARGEETSYLYLFKMRQSLQSIHQPLATLTLLFLALPAFAQQPTLDTVLTRLQQNATIYTLSLPNFFVDESFHSEEFYGASERQNFTTVSALRVLNKPADANHPAKLIELREVHTVNKRPAHGDQVKGSIALKGSFDTALTMFTGAHVTCFTYELLPPPDPQHLLLSFTAKDKVSDDCPATIAGETGRALLDPQTMQPVHIERTVPHAEGAGLGTFLWSIDFAPTTLGDRVFNMPTSIRTKLFSKYSTHFFQTNATYTNYHHLTVSSTILPTTNAPQP